MTPQRIDTVPHLEELLSEPSPAAVEVLSRLDGDLVLLGVGGKMGPTLARMARRAFDLAGKKSRVVGVSRFSEAGTEESLRSHGVETIRCDLLDAAQVDALPEAPNVIFMTGLKFGSSTEKAKTWAMNALVPVLAGRKYRQSRIVAFSTGNVYGMTPVAWGGSLETDPLKAMGEYAMSCVGRERMFEYVSQEFGTKVVLLRLNYAHDLRYGVLVDLALKVWKSESVPLAMGHFNALWQGDANAMTLQALERCASPVEVVNLAGPELLSVRRVAVELAKLMNRKATFEGTESADAFLSNSQKAIQWFGYPRIGAKQLIEWTADWIRRGGANLRKPTHFENREGAY